MSTHTLGALAVAALLALPAPGAAQLPLPPVGATRLLATTRPTFVDPPPARRLSPMRAAIYSAIVPGAGQVYAREPRRGLVLGAIWAGGLALAFNDHSDYGHVGGLISLGTVVYAVMDAPAAVRRTEAREAARRAKPITN